MSDGKQFNHEELLEAKFHGCRLAQAEFDNVDLSQSKFNGVNLRDSSFTDVNLANVSIDDANIAGLTIFGWGITELITEAQKRKASNWDTTTWSKRLSVSCATATSTGATTSRGATIRYSLSRRDRCLAGREI